MESLLPIPPLRPTPDWILAIRCPTQRAIWIRRQETDHEAYWTGPVGQARLQEVYPDAAALLRGC